MMHFAWPYVFLLTPLPFLVWRLLPRTQTQQAALKVPHFSRFSMPVSTSHRRSAVIGYTKLAVLSALWILLIISAANPQRLGEEVSDSTSGRDLMLAVDVSGSMREEDMIINQQRLARIVVVKYLVGEFIEKRKGDRVGLILFGTNAYVQAPLTFDTQTVQQFLQEATLKIAGEKTAIGDAIGLAVKRLRDRPASQRVLILLTDGENTAGNIAPRQAADLAAQAGVKIHTIGVGSDRSSFGFGFSRGSEIDEATLEYVAQSTGGQYFRARNPDELQSIYGQLDQIEAIDHDAKPQRRVQSLYYYPLGIAMTLALLALGTLVLMRTRRSKAIA